jgi:hypothetical protein
MNGREGSMSNAFNKMFFRFAACGNPGMALAYAHR